jgi:preprotein translocase SecF subunit
VSFREQSSGKEGRVNLRLRLTEAAPFPVIMSKLEDAGLGANPRDLVVEDLDPDVTTTGVTLSVPAGSVNAVKERIKSVFTQPQPIQKIVSIGSTVAREMKARALLAVVCASLIIVFYVALRFHAIKFGVAAVIALLHDVGIAAGLVALANWTGVLGEIKIDLPILAAFLTIIGYSLNDSIVVFDRIRENMVEMGRDDVNEDLVDTSINQTLSRTVLTSLTTLLVVFVLYILGGPVLRGLAFTLIVGVLVGTYSSMFIASPVLLDWANLRSGAGLFFRVLFYPITAPLRLLGGSSK